MEWISVKDELPKDQELVFVAQIDDDLEYWYSHSIYTDNIEGKGFYEGYYGQPKISKLYHVTHFLRVKPPNSQ